MTPEVAILRKLSTALDSVLHGADSAARIMGPLPDTAAAFAGLDDLRGTGARALLKAVEQAQDILARMFRTYLLAEQIDLSTMTARDIANRMEKYGLLDSADQWSALVRLRNRLAHEYPVSPTEQLERVTDALAAVPQLRGIRDTLVSNLHAKGYAP
ncbi:HepT-like ribonuclease domain-containing protein [Sphingomonas sp.]|uniref:HepT-like ribonuclease domain-containing protein n=1 Tax=Sphingomonas sp. TaxID=28214 RepID=UPI002BFAC11C|nr:HepT-like ribonuclease domain-containing protein [Sphingomonas sp.]HTG39934.1 HepT-like ribonuclease domain-containing protein [Sphingomonas sp.]